MPLLASIRAPTPLLASTRRYVADAAERTVQEHRAHDRRKHSEDPTTILAGEIGSREEWAAWAEYESKMSFRQKLTVKQIMALLAVRHSFVHGGFRKVLTGLAVYAAASEFLHDFFHEYETIHHLLGLVGTEHAVGLIALSHLSEHFKEWLEDQDKPAHHVQERHRLDVLRIFAGGKQPYWPRHILWYHDWWDGHRGDMGCFVHAKVQAELKAADKKGGGGH